MSDVTFGRYETDRLIGSGSFADVFLCYHPGLETKVAIKVLHAHLARDNVVRERFLQEAQVLWRADSDRVIQVTHVDQLPDGRPYLVMRYADRGTLDDVIQQRIGAGRPFSLKESVGLGMDLVDCLNEIRDRDLVHRDLKPLNILVKSLRTPDHRRAELYGLAADERMVLADFGLAKSLQDGTNFASQLGGTPLYMAPELGSLTVDVSWRADLFAVGVILHELTTGVVPWPNRGLAQVREVDLAQASVHRRRPDFPQALDEILYRCLAPEPADRFDDPDELGAALESLLNSNASAPAPPQNSIEVARVVCREVANAFPASATQVAKLESELDRRVRVGVIGGNRLSPVPLGLKLVGERPPPGEASLLGSVVVRLHHGDPGLVAVMQNGDRREGSWSKGDDGYLRLDLPGAPWSIAQLELQLPRPDIEGTEVIDIPHAVVRRNADLARDLYESLDVCVVGLPAEQSAAFAAIEEVLGLSQDGEGPFGIIGVRQLGVTSAAEHPVLLGTVPGDDTMELRVLLEEILSGTRPSDAIAGTVFSAIREIVVAGDPSGRWVAYVDEAASRSPSMTELQTLRSDLAGSRLTAGPRQRLHRVLGRQMAAARLGVVPDADVDLLLSYAADERRAWERSDDVAPDQAAQLVRSLSRLEVALRARRAGQTHGG